MRLGFLTLRAQDWTMSDAARGIPVLTKTDEEPGGCGHVCLVDVASRRIAVQHASPGIGQAPVSTREGLMRLQPNEFSGPESP